ncbi:MAG: thioredoxin domain-containing protein, partial [Hyphomicrobiaceae bacterium]
VLKEISRIYQEEPTKVSTNASLITEKLNQGADLTGSGASVGDDAFQQTARQIYSHMDLENGGLQGAPKFPQYTLLWFLWRAGIRYNTPEYLDAVTLTLDRICQGGIYDHLGGGFARYSVDERWLAPHFEKMLYDNALLLLLLSESWRETQSTLFATRIEETIDWLVREMRLDDGGFSSSLDADSEGEEGKFYVWSQDEIAAALGKDDAAFFGAVYDVSAEGNWEGHTILNRLRDTSERNPKDEKRLAKLRSKLFEVREPRIRPGLDDKVLADWNGMTIAALVRCATAFEKSDWLSLAREAYTFVTASMTSEGRLIHSWRGHPSAAPAIAADYANMIWGALELYQATGEAAFLDDAKRWVGTLDAHYWLEDAGGYAMTADDTESLIVRTRAAHDDATPNANAIMLSNLATLFQLTGDLSFNVRAEKLLAAFSTDIARNPIGHTGMMGRAMDVISAQHLAIMGADSAAFCGPFRDVLRKMSLPGVVVEAVADATRVASGSPLYDKTADGGQPTAYFCSAGTCSLPVTDANTLEDLLRAGRELTA